MSACTTPRRLDRMNEMQQPGGALANKCCDYSQNPRPLAGARQGTAGRTAKRGARQKLGASPNR